MPRARRPWCLPAAVLAGVLVAMLAPVAVQAQSTGETQRKLEKVNRELKEVAAERRRIEGRRGDASRQLREVDEKVGASTRNLRETEAELARQQAALAELRDRRDTMQVSLAARRDELGALLRAAYAIGEDAPLKLMLSQDKVAEAARALAYHRYLQRDRMQRIEALSAELAELERVEAEITQRQAALDAAKARQRAQLAELESDRRERRATVATLDERYQDRRDREKALGKDARSLEKLLARLREAAAKAAAARRAAEAAAAARAKEGGTSHKAPPPPIEVAKTAPIKVGGLGWPVSGTLVAGYGAPMPDGSKSAGVLIGAPAGTTVKAVADGTVVFSEWMTGYGLILIIDHGNGYMSLYAYNDALLKDAGAQVKRGDPVASVGNSGGQGRPALYFELRRNGNPVNPGSWLQKR
ncbi:murein hydrolase activator EnvC family protein [Luteimonas soli]|uniref:Murein hydrolase activator EnvC family protein n=1 Tax=Luteimonas soli TaxID=1648966 RepID=A0ABV7XIN3_9GAMM